MCLKKIKQLNLENDHDGSLSQKPSNVEILANQINNAPLKLAMTLKKFVHLNIMTLRKCITLKYL